MLAFQRHKQIIFSQGSYGFHFIILSILHFSYFQAILRWNHQFHMEGQKLAMKDLWLCIVKWNPLLLWNSVHMWVVNMREGTLFIMNIFLDSVSGSYSSSPNWADPGHIFIILLESYNASAHGKSKQAPITSPMLQPRPFYFPDNSSPWENQIWYVSSLRFYEAVNATTLIYQEAASTKGRELEPNWFLKHLRK